MLPILERGRTTLLAVRPAGARAAALAAALAEEVVGAAVGALGGDGDKTCDVFKVRASPPQPLSRTTRATHVSGAHI